jgi:hypothetical protein
VHAPRATAAVAAVAIPPPVEDLIMSPVHPAVCCAHGHQSCWQCFYAAAHLVRTCMQHHTACSSHASLRMYYFSHQSSCTASRTVFYCLQAPASAQAGGRMPSSACSASTLIPAVLPLSSIFCIPHCVVLLFYYCTTAVVLPLYCLQEPASAPAGGHMLGFASSASM